MTCQKGYPAYDATFLSLLPGAGAGQMAKVLWPSDPRGRTCNVL